VSFLLKLEKEEDWDDSTISTYMMIMMSGSLINCLIVSFIVSIFQSSLYILLNKVLFML